MSSGWIEPAIVAVIVVAASVGLVLALRRDPCAGCSLKEHCPPEKRRKRKKRQG